MTKTMFRTLIHGYFAARWRLEATPGATCPTAPRAGITTFPRARGLAGARAMFRTPTPWATASPAPFPLVQEVQEVQGVRHLFPRPSTPG